MHTSSLMAGPRPSHRLPFWSGVVLLALGLVGHLYAAHAIGGSRVAYTHHVLGFAFILLVTGGIIAAVSRQLWPSRMELTMLVIGAVQALIGLLVALDPVRAAAGT